METITNFEKRFLLPATECLVSLTKEIETVLDYEKEQIIDEVEMGKKNTVAVANRCGGFSVVKTNLKSWRIFQKRWLPFRSLPYFCRSELHSEQSRNLHLQVCC